MLQMKHTFSIRYLLQQYVSVSIFCFRQIPDNFRTPIKLDTKKDMFHADPMPINLRAETK